MLRIQALLCQLALVSSCLAQGLPACSCWSGDTPGLHLHSAHGQHSDLHSGECWGGGWSKAGSMPGARCVTTHSTHRWGRLPITSPLHSLVSPFEIVAHKMGTIHLLS